MRERLRRTSSLGIVISKASRTARWPKSWPALAVLAASMALCAPAAAAGISVPGEGGTGEVPVSGERTQVLSLARTELLKDVRERRSDNVPRYKGGRGAIAPYSIHAAWCAAFSTWIWGKAGFTDYLSARYVWPAYGGDLVAVQVKDLRRWAKRNDRWTLNATAGDLLAYGNAHIGIVVKVDRSRRATYSIEGNASDRVRKVKVDWSRVTGYISPTALVPAQRVTRSSPLADIE